MVPLRSSKLKREIRKDIKANDKTANTYEKKRKVEEKIREESEILSHKREMMKNVESEKDNIAMYGTYEKQWKRWNKKIQNKILSHSEII